MINPSIALSYHPQTQLESPLQAYGQAMSLQSMANQQTLQGQQIQQNDVKLKTHTSLNAAIQQATVKDAQGNVKIDAAKVQKIMSDAGFGAAGDEWADSHKKSDLELDKLTNEQLTAAGNVQRTIAGTLSAVRSTPEDGSGKRQQAWTAARQQAITTMKADPATIPETVPDEASLVTLEDSALDAHQRIALRLQKQNADSSEKRADAQDKRADAYLQRITDQGEAENWREGSPTPEGYRVMFNSRTGETKVDTKNKIAFKDSAGSGSRGLTANGEAVEGRFEAKLVNDARGDLDDIHTQRTALGNAMKIKDGQDFVNPLTKKSETMDEETRASLQDQLDNVTNKGKRIMRQWGGAASRGVIGANEFGDSGRATSGATSTTPKSDGPKGGSKAWKYVPGQGLVAK